MNFRDDAHNHLLLVEGTRLREYSSRLPVDPTNSSILQEVILGVFSLSSFTAPRDQVRLKFNSLSSEISNF